MITRAMAEIRDGLAFYGEGRGQELRRHARNGHSATKEEVIPVYEEQVKVGMRAVEQGRGEGPRLHRRDPVQEGVSARGASRGRAPAG